MITPAQEAAPQHRRTRPVRSFDRLEARVLLAAVPAADLAAAIPLGTPSDTKGGEVAPGAPVFYKVAPAAASHLIATVHSSDGVLTRLSLLDAGGNLLVQSDAQSSANHDDRIVQDVNAGPEYLEVQALGGPTSFTLRTSLVNTEHSATTGGTESGPIAFGDLSGDGTVDFVAPDGVHKGLGNGTFSNQPIPLPAGPDPNARITAIATGDFTGNHKVNVAVAEFDYLTGQAMIEILQNEGGDTFRAEAPITLPGGVAVKSLVTGDFKGDGHEDIAVEYGGLYDGSSSSFYGYGYGYGSGGGSGPGLGQVAVLWNLGAGAFGAPTSVPLGSSVSFVDAIAAGGLGVGGKDELVVAGFEALETLGVDGAGQFQVVSSVSTSVFDPVGIVTGDFNGDGRTDIAIAGGNSVQTFLGDGQGGIAAGQLISLGDPTTANAIVSANAIATGDFGANGQDAIAVSGFAIGGTRLEVLTNTGKGTFIPQPSVALGLNQVNSLVSGDFTAAGSTELAVVAYGATAGAYDVMVQPPGGVGVQVKVASGEFTGDGQNDLAVARVSGDQATLDVMLGNGDGTFREAPTIALGAVEVGSIVTGDFNGDGRTDIALTEYDPSTDLGRLEVLLGKGDGTFVAEAPLPLPMDLPKNLTTGHFTSNGHLDLALTVSDPTGTVGEVLVLLGDGAGGFQVGPAVDLKGLEPQSLVSGDFGPGGLDDLVVAGTSTGTGGGGIGFGNGFPYGLGNGFPYGLGSDYGLGNGYGYGYGGSVGPQVRTFLSNGDGTFTAGSTTPLGNFFTIFQLKSLVSGDFDGDGKPDLFVEAQADYYGVAISYGEVLQGNGDGSFQTSSVPTALSMNGLTPNAIAVGRAAGDDRDSLVVDGFDSTTDQGTIEILQEGAAGTLTTSTPFSLGAINPLDLIAGNFTGGGRLDVAFVSDSDSSFVEVLRGSSTFGSSTTFVPTAILGGSPLGTAGPFASGDFNGDGRPDIAVSGSSAPGAGYVQVQLGNGDGSFQPQTLIDLPGFTPLFLVADNLPDAGRDDLASVGFDAQGLAAVEVIGSQPDGTFSVAGSIVLGDIDPVAVATGDFTGNGQVDIAVAGIAPDGSSVLELLLGNGDGTFSAPIPVGLGAFNARALAAGQFTSDGRDDLAIAGDTPAGQGLIELLTGVGGILHLSTPVALGDLGVTSLVSGDFVANGAPGLAVLGDDEDTGQSSVLVVEGSGNGTFAAPIAVYQGPGLADGLLTGDFNGDGRTDLFVVSGFAQPVEAVLLGNGDGTFQPATASSLTLLPAPTLAVDLNGDGRTDLAFDDGGAQGVQLALGLGNGQFADPSNFTGDVQSDPVTANLGDGAVDVFVVDQSGEILWRKGVPQSPGTFEPPIVINPGAPSRDIVLIETSRGPLIASVDLKDNGVTLYLDEGGHFIRVGSLATGLFPAQIIAADLTGDGDQDLVIRDAGDGEAWVYLGDGAGNFVLASEVSIGPGASDIAVANLGRTINGALGPDGRPFIGPVLHRATSVDLIVTNRLSGEILVFPGFNNGQFGDPLIYQAGTGAYAMAEAAAGSPEVSSQQATAGVAVAALTTGGPDSLIAIDPGANSLAILDGLGDGAFANAASLFTTSPDEVIRSAVVDGKPLVAVLGADGVSVYLGDGNGGFKLLNTYNAGTNPTGLTLADLGNGNLDILVGDGYGDVLELVGDGHGGFMPYSNIDQQIALSVADSGPGGQPQFALANTGANTVAVQASLTAKAATVSDASKGILNPGAVTLADLNGDGIPDLIVVNSGANDILVYLGLGAGQYNPDPQTFAVGTDPVSVTVAKLTDSVVPDLIVANKGSNDLSILLGEGQGSSWTLKPLVRLKTGDGPTATAVADVSGGGIPDILVSDSQSNDVRVLQGVGNGFFDDVHPTVYSTGNDPGPLFVGNFTGLPNQVNVATLNSGSDSLSVFLGINTPTVSEENLSSGGVDPISAVELPSGGGAMNLLVANNADGEFDLFQGGSDGLSAATPFEVPGLPNPTALAMDPSSGQVFGATEGIESAIPVILGFGAEPGGLTTGGSPGGSGSGGGGASLALSGSGDQQVATLQPLTQSSLAIVATLLSVAIETMGEGAPGSSSVGALPNQPPQNRAPISGTGEETELAGAEGQGQGQAPPAQAPLNPLNWFVGGLQDAFDQARQRALGGSLLPNPAGDGEPAGAANEDQAPPPAQAQAPADKAAWSFGGPRDALDRASGSPLSAGAPGGRIAMQVLSAVDEILTGWSPALNPAGGARSASVVDAAISSIAADRTMAAIEPPPTAETPLSLEIGIAAVSLAIVARPLADRARVLARSRDREAGRGSSRDAQDRDDL